MRELIVTTNDKKLSYRALTGVGAKEMPKCVGDSFIIKEIIQGEVVKQDGETAVLSCILTTHGDIYQTLSPTVNDNINVIMQVFDISQDEVEVKITEGKSNNGRDFLQLEVI